MLHHLTDYNFSIKCGGPSLKTLDGIAYERDNEALGPATYYVPTSNRWAVSNAGQRADAGSPEYINTSSSRFANTVDPTLFQIARTSGGSLRYYGLGLENGNYTVKLQFAEIAIPNPPGWRSIARRIFDIYIQVCVNFFPLVISSLFIFCGSSCLGWMMNLSHTLSFAIFRSIY